MKNLFKVIVLNLAAGIAATIGMLGGAWLWGNVLEDKAENLKKRFGNDEDEGF